MTTITIVDSLWRHNENCCYANMRSQGQAFVCWHLNLSVTCGTVVPRRWTCLSVILPYSTTLFHCIPVLQIVTEIGRVFIMLLYPPLNEVEGGYTGFTLSVHPSVSTLFSMLFSALYGWDAENWECGNILRVISVLWLKCGDNAEISPYSCPNTPIRIFSAFPPHFFPHFFHIRMRRFLRVPVRILPSAFSPQGKCGDLGYGPTAQDAVAMASAMWRMISSVF